MAKCSVVRAPQFARPANTTQYTAGDLVANNATAGSVVPLLFDLQNVSKGTSGKVVGGLLRKSTATVTVATFALHLFANISPVVTNGDNGALLITTPATDLPNYIGTLPFDFATIGNDIAIAGGPLIKAAVPALGILGFFARQRKIYGLIEAIGAYTPASGETFDASITVEC
jgi:hypothetical protein